MTSPDERREVAKKLRGALTKNEMKRAIGLSTETDYMWQTICCRLADLIDPALERTCYVVKHAYYGSHAEDSEWELSCGHTEIGYKPAYCPVCGARVVSGDD